MTSLHRVATHEAGHAVAAVTLRLPVREVLIRDDGTGSEPAPAVRQASGSA
jgi:hypothetical protein